MNSKRSQIVDLTDADLKPEGWDTVTKPALDAPEDIVIYELHIRDFSISDQTVPEELRGTYKAFTVKDSNGMKHLSTLAQAGLTHIHLLPAFDIASVNEDKSTWQTVDEAELKASLPPDSDEQSIAVSAITASDGFNWGYDPLHYTTPEGSYATDPMAQPRIVEFREMVQSLNESGLRVVMDVVYNHTNASGQSENSVLDRVVPGYYHRLNADGAVEKSTCCENTATEHDMMRKLMIDSVVTWAKEYKVDGFRFDLMGHHMLEDMIAVRAALDALTLEKDGVDGKSIYVYGEGWDFGEVANNARGKNATQLNIAGQASACSTTACATRCAAAARSAIRAMQGFATGLVFTNNANEARKPKTSRSSSTTTPIGSASGWRATWPVTNHPRRWQTVPGG
jgi:pullulanase